MVCIVPLASNSAESELVDIKVPCTNTKIIVDSLSKEYRETPFVLGRANDRAKSVMSLWVNPITKSWTIIATMSEVSCVIGAGDSFQLVPSDQIKTLKTL